MSQPGYLLFLGHSLDMEKMGRYSAAVSPVYKQFGGTYLGIGGPGRGTELLEGAWFDHSLILTRFPTSEDVSRFWNSPEYAKVRELRKDGGSFQAFSLKGENAEPHGGEGRQSIKSGAFAPGGQPAYLISIYRPFDPDAYKKVAEAEAEKIKSRDFYYLAKAGEGDADRLEGDLISFCFSIIACPTQPAATAFWNDPGYAEIRKARAQAAGVNTFLMAGMAR